MKRFSLILRRGQSFKVFSAPMARCLQMQIRCRRIGKENWWGVGGSRVTDKSFPVALSHDQGTLIVNLALPSLVADPNFYSV
jgi:hypothetical protein